MKNNLMEYPHPVLVPGGKDFTDSSFSMSLIEQNDENKELVFKFKCELKCESLKEMISKGALKIIIKITVKIVLNTEIIIYQIEIVTFIKIICMFAKNLICIIKKSFIIVFA